MHSPACSIHVAAAKPRKPELTRVHAIRRGGEPRLDWQTNIRGADPIKSVDVLGLEGFRRAGLCAWAAASQTVRLFVFAPPALIPSRHGNDGRCESGCPSCTTWRHEG